MAFTFAYNGINIADEIDFASIRLYDRLGGMFDNIEVDFPYSDDMDIARDSEKGDRITVTTDGFTSGVMYVDDISENDSFVTINAISCRNSSQNTKSKIWRDVKLSEILNDVARNYGLTLKSYGYIDYTYPCIVQRNETDLKLLERICAREGYSIKIDDDCLVVFDDYTMENESNPIKIDLNDDSIKKQYFFNDTSDYWHSVTVLYYDFEKKTMISQSYSDDECITGNDITIIEQVSSYDEAKRYARAYLRNKNKNRYKGIVSMEYNPKISAGTVLELSGFRGNDGRYIVYKVVHDVLNEITKVYVRKTLSY